MHPARYLVVYRRFQLPVLHIFRPGAKLRFKGLLHVGVPVFREKLSCALLERVYTHARGGSLTMITNKGSKSKTHLEP
jgi:hypothetical protein